MKNWRTNLGGAISITGTSLIGIGVLPQLLVLNADTHDMLSHAQLSFLWWIAVSGFILSCVGKGVTSLFAADAAVVQKQITTVATAVDKINQNGPDSDTDMLTKPKPPTT